MTLQSAATHLLRLLAKSRESSDTHGLDGATLTEITSLSVNDINDAVALLERSGFVEWRRYLGTAPYTFGHIWITPVGRYETERLESLVADPLVLTEKAASADVSLKSTLILPPTPIGSPYGFTDEDWEVIAARKGDPERLVVVCGYQFTSRHYDSTELRKNVEVMFERAVTKYNAQPGALSAILDFRALGAGYGEHLFNEIARDIISSDIAVFETSDLNPNVMLELGVALTWGVRVLPIKLHTQPKPPSDVSGQTWADYGESAASFVDPEHDDKLVRMVERAMRKKGRR